MSNNQERSLLVIFLIALTLMVVIMVPRLWRARETVPVPTTEGPSAEDIARARALTESLPPGKPLPPEERAQIDAAMDQYAAPYDE